MATYARKRLFVDAEVQGRFALRAVAYWLGCMTVVMGMAMLGRLLMKPTEPFFTSGESLWACLAPLVLATVLVLPVMVYDIIVVTHRLVGPLLRLRGAMRRLANGETVEPIRFRKGDFWQEFADEFNAVAALVQSHRQAAQNSARPNSFAVNLDETAEVEATLEEPRAAHAAVTG
ncbi:MAG TPA: hypothetical protein VHC19_23075 [Pirellulales bacterium]|jgi:hypothetical protein|nr:hypothetical protein [Pirellulales bacterium]